MTIPTKCTYITQYISTQSSFEPKNLMFFSIVSFRTLKKQMNFSTKSYFFVIFFLDSFYYIAFWIKYARFKWTPFSFWFHLAEDYILSEYFSGGTELNCYCVDFYITTPFFGRNIKVHHKMGIFKNDMGYFNAINNDWISTVENAFKTEDYFYTMKIRWIKLES